MSQAMNDLSWLTGFKRKTDDQLSKMSRAERERYYERLQVFENIGKVSAGQNVKKLDERQKRELENLIREQEQQRDQSEDAKDDGGQGATSGSESLGELANFTGDLSTLDEARINMSALYRYQGVDVEAALEEAKKLNDLCAMAAVYTSLIIGRITKKKTEKHLILKTKFGNTPLVQWLSGKTARQPNVLILSQYAGMKFNYLAQQSLFRTIIGNGIFFLNDNAAWFPLSRPHAMAHIIARIWKSVQYKYYLPPNLSVTINQINRAKELCVKNGFNPDVFTGMNLDLINFGIPEVETAFETIFGISNIMSILSQRAADRNQAVSDTDDKHRKNMDEAEALHDTISRIDDVQRKLATHAFSYSALAAGNDGGLLLAVRNMFNRA